MVLPKRLNLPCQGAEECLSVYLDFSSFYNRVPVLCCMPNLPVNVDSCSETFVRAVHPETSHVVASLYSGKCKLTFCSFFFAMKIVPIW